MNPKLVDELTELIKTWAAVLRISDYKYDFKMLSNHEMSGDYAKISTEEDTRRVTIDFNKSRLTKEPQEIVTTVVHELLHTRFNEYSDFITDVLKTYVNSPATRKLLLKRTEVIEHKIVVALTDALCPTKER